MWTPLVHLNYKWNKDTSALVFYFTYNSSALVGSTFGSTWENPVWWVFRICIKKSFKTRPNSPYGEETSSYSLLQQGVISMLKWANVLLMLTLALVIIWAKVQTQRCLRYFSTFLHSWPHLTKEVIFLTLHSGLKILLLLQKISMISSKAEFNFSKKKTFDMSKAT